MEHLDLMTSYNNLLHLFGSIAVFNPKLTDHPLSVKSGEYKVDKSPYVVYFQQIVYCNFVIARQLLRGLEQF